MGKVMFQNNCWTESTQMGFLKQKGLIAGFWETKENKKEIMV